MSKPDQGQSGGEYHCPLCNKTVDECEGHDPEEYEGEVLL